MSREVEFGEKLLDVGVWGSTQHNALEMLQKIVRFQCFRGNLINLLHCKFD